MFTCLVLLIFVGSIAAEECKFQTPCKCVLPDNKVIDLSSVGTLDYPKFYEIPNNKTQCNDTELYSYNPCYSFSSSDKHTSVKGDHRACDGAAACIRTPGGDTGELPEEFVIGTQDSAHFWTSNTHYVINYTAPGAKKTLMVKLHCEEHGKHSLKIIEPHCSNDSTIIFELFSICACPDKCAALNPPKTETPSGLSVGSKLLIAFFTIILAYFIVGVFWNFCNGAKGAELVPNLDFWNELPTLIMEGVVFSCSCCGRQGTYGEV